MRKHYDKFIFLGVMILAALVGGGLRSTGSASPIPVKESAALSSVVAAIPPASAGASPSGPAGTLRTEDIVPRNVFVRKANEGLPTLKVEEAIIADLQSGETYLEINSDKRWPMASVTKLVTAAYASLHMEPDRLVTLGSRDFSALGGDVGHVLNPGESYSVSDLIRAMLTFSSNEAAEALANSYGRTDFLLGMNELAHSWGMTETNFSDPTGLSVANQSTAKDFVILARRIYNEHPNLFAITRTPQATLTELGTGKKFPFININSFAGQPDFLGGKTGFTDEAQGNLLSIFEYAGRPVVIAVMGTGERFGETKKLLAWFESDFTPIR